MVRIDNGLIRIQGGKVLKVIEAVAERKRERSVCPNCH